MTNFCDVDGVELPKRYQRIARVDMPGCVVDRFEQTPKLRFALWNDCPEDHEV